jgi:hypothetical protein
MINPHNLHIHAMYIHLSEHAHAQICIPTCSFRSTEMSQSYSGASAGGSHAGEDPGFTVDGFDSSCSLEMDALRYKLRQSQRGPRPKFSGPSMATFCMESGIFNLGSDLNGADTALRASPRASNIQSVCADNLGSNGRHDSMLNINGSSSQDCNNGLRIVHNCASFRGSSSEKNASGSSNNTQKKIKVKDRRFSFLIEDEESESKMTCAICATRNVTHCRHVRHHDNNGGRLVIRANKRLQRWKQAASSWLSGIHV